MISLEMNPLKASAQSSSAEEMAATEQQSNTVLRKPRLGFLGVGWIGRNRMQAVGTCGLAEIAAIADASTEMRDEAAKIAPRAHLYHSAESLLDEDLDGVVIATPSALHANQSEAALKRGIAVFCQKPLARTAQETRRVVECARESNTLLGVDLSYRFVNGVPQLRDIIQGGELGDVYSIDMVFHNAYGPDKPWFYDPQLSGGGCLIDLGIHLVDLALWVLDYPKVCTATSRLYAQGKPWNGKGSTVEDFAVSQLHLSNGSTVQLACSWKAHAGCDALIRASFYGTKGGMELRNVDGSFYEFVVERFSGTKRQTIAEPPDPWSGRAIVDWVQRLTRGSGYDSSIEGLIEVSETLDKIYER